MNKRLSESVEDYLKAIYRLTQGSQRASTNAIADQMGVTPASATGMLQRMAAADPALVDYQKHHGVALTPAGEQSALEVLRHHRLLEAYLHEKLGYEWDEVHAEADRLEHAISEEFEERISQELGDPKFDPHGDPIPTRDLALPSQSFMPLSELQRGEQAIVERINDDDPQLLRYLASIGLVPDCEVTAVAASPFDGNLQLEIAGKDPVVLGVRVTSQVFVSRKER